MTRVTLVCKTCGYTARRDLQDQPGNRGTRKTGSEPAPCPRGHGEMVRQSQNVAQCSECNAEVPTKPDGTLQYHDAPRFTRRVCPGSLKKL